jgi:hypothetical protein
MADIFISYSQKEPQPTRDVAAFLTSEGYAVWWDLNLIPGDRIANIIEQELNNADAVIVIWTFDSVVSDWVISEAEHGRRQRKLIPLKTRDLTEPIPKPFDTFYTGFADDRTAILAAVRRLVGVRTTDQHRAENMLLPGVEAEQHKLLARGMASKQTPHRRLLSHALAVAMGFLLFASANWWFDNPNSQLVTNKKGDRLAMEPQPHPLDHPGPLVGLPVDPLTNYDYDTARDIAKVVSALSEVPSSMAGLRVAFGQRDGGESAINVAKALGVGFGGPTAVHLIGTFAINNFGGLGGGL